MMRVVVKLTLIYCQLPDSGPDKLCLLYIKKKKKNMKGNSHKS